MLLLNLSPYILLIVVVGFHYFAKRHRVYFNDSFIDLVYNPNQLMKN